MELFFKILLYLFDAVIGALFVASFTKTPKEKRCTLVIAAATAIFVSSPFYSGTPSIIPVTPDIIHYVLSLAVLYFLGFSHGSSDTVSKIASPIIFEAVSIFTGSIAIMYFNVNVLPEIPGTDTSAIVAMVAATVAVSKILMASVLLVTLKIVSRDGNHRFLTILTLSLSPIFTLFTLYLYMKIVYSTSGVFSTEIYVALSGTAILNLLTFILFDRTVKAEADNNRLQLYMNKYEMERIRYSDILKANWELRSVKHDLKNHLLLLKKYSSEKDFEGIDRYIASFEQTVEDVGFPTLSGNAMLDYVIASKTKQLDDVTCLVSGVFSDFPGVDDVDLAVLVGNLMDNAIDALSKLDRKEKLIEVTLSVKGGYQNIIIKNDVDASVMENNKSLFTTKEDKKYHGFGLKSVRSITEKYNGICEFYEEDGKFCVQVALPLNNN